MNSDILNPKAIAIENDLNDESDIEDKDDEDYVPDEKKALSVKRKKASDIAKALARASVVVYISVLFYF